MIIYGIKTTESTVGTGAFLCPRCQTSQPCRRLAYKRWFTLYFVPLIPLGRAGEQVECQGCFSRYSPDVLSRAGQTATLDAILIDAPASAHTAAARGAQSSPRTTPLAATSLILGILSPVFLCACGLSLLTSAGAIVTGHLALRKINRSSGQLAGQGMAITGLVMGYLLFAISVSSLALLGPPIYEGWQGAQQAPAQQAALAGETPQERLRAAEMHVLTKSTHGAATGNTLEAEQLAEEYSRTLNALREMLFTKDRARLLSLTDGEFVVHCQLQRESCAFIVHVPSYRDYTDDAKSLLEATAWQLAQQIVEEKLAPGDSLAVALRGVALYGAVLLGPAGLDESNSNNFTRSDRESLLAFFVNDGQSADVVSSAPPSPRDEPPLLFDSRKALASSPPPDAFADTEAAASVKPTPTDTPPALASNGQTPDLSTAPGRPRPPPPFDPPRPPLQMSSTTPATAASPSVAPPLGDVLHQFPEMGWPVQSLAFSPDGRYLAVGKLDEAVLLYDVEAGKRLHAETSLRELGQIACLAFAHDRRMLFAGGYRGAIQAWSIDDAGYLRAADSLSRHAHPVTMLVASPAAGFVLSGSAGGDLMWQSYDKAGHNTRTLAAFGQPVIAAYLPAQGIQAAATDGRRLIHFDLRDGRIAKSFELGRGVAMAAAFSSDGSRLAISGGSDVQLWDAQNGAKVATFSAADGIQWSLAFLPDGQRLISGGRGAATVWRHTDGAALGSIDLGGVLYIKSLAVARNGGLVAAIPSSAGQTLTLMRITDAD